jgi:hypothetical protein
MSDRRSLCLSLVGETWKSSFKTTLTRRECDYMPYEDSLSSVALLLDVFVFDTVVSSGTSALSPPLSNSMKDQTPVPLNLSEPPKAYFPRSNALLMDQ